MKQAKRILALLLCLVALLSLGACGSAPAEDAAPDGDQTTAQDAGGGDVELLNVGTKAYRATELCIGETVTHTTY